MHPCISHLMWPQDESIRLCACMWFEICEVKHRPRSTQTKISLISCCPAPLSLAKTLSSVHSMRGCAMRYRGSFYPLMAQGKHGYCLDGHADKGHRNGSLFFGVDSLHPWSQSLQRMAELAIHLYHKECSFLHSYHSIFAHAKL
jgi:hypothetical protein